MLSRMNGRADTPQKKKRAKDDQIEIIPAEPTKPDPSLLVPGGPNGLTLGPTDS